MPFRITQRCLGTETICKDICPSNCIQTTDATLAKSRNRFQIDEQFCFDCGVCATACPEKAIVYAGAYNSMSYAALGQAIWLRPLAKRPFPL
jgi:ferredoxin--NADP+ reductase